MVSELFDLCILKVAEHCEIIPDVIFKNLPQILLEALIQSLSAGQLLRLEELFRMRNLHTEFAWKACFDLRWHKTYERASSVFTCRRFSAQTQYLNRHFQEVFNHVINERWAEAIDFENRINTPRHQILSTTLCIPKEVDECQKQQLLSKLQVYSGFVKHWSMYASHCYRLLMKEQLMQYLLNVQSIRIIILKDSSLLATLTLLHKLRTHGKLEEINIYTCRLSQDNAAKFVHFCQNCDSRRAKDIVSDGLICENLTVPHVNINASSLDMIVMSSKRRKIDTLYNFNDSSGDGSADDEEENLYDAALRPVVQDTMTTTKSCFDEHLIEQSRDQWSHFSVFFCHIADKAMYSKISCLSVHENDISNLLEMEVLKRIPCWRHLVAIALDFGKIYHDLWSNLHSAFCQLEEFHWLDSPCPLHLLDMEAINQARSCPMHRFVMNAIIGHDDDISQAPNIPRYRLSTKHLEVIGNHTLSPYSLAPFRQFLETDKALHTVQLTNIYTDHEDVAQCLESLHKRVSAGLPIDGLTIHNLKILRPVDIPFTADHSPIKLQTLTSLRLTECWRSKDKWSLMSHVSDIVSHPNLREVRLSDNDLGDTGCHLLESVCVAMVMGSSRLHTLDLSCNNMNGDKVADISLSVASLSLTKHRTERCCGRRLYLSDNLLTTEHQRAVTRNFSVLWELVEAQIGKTSMAEYVAQM